MLSNLSTRQEQIRRLLAEQGRLTVQELAGRLRVAAMTIRRDLAALEEAGVLTRTHGGCVLHSPFVAEMSFPSKQRLRQAQKAAIARETVRQLRRGQAIYLDTGTTALQIARALPPDWDVRVFTNNLRVAMELLGRNRTSVVVYGGMLGNKSPDLAGEIAVAQMQQFRVDVAIVGGDALDVTRGEFYGADTETALISRVAQRQADRVVVAMDSSKIGKRGLAVAGRLEAGTTLITDDEIGPTVRGALRKTGAALICATVNGATF
jgi:DeoR/GlpR family transcriptional regulator of sugar metabolism